VYDGRGDQIALQLKDIIYTEDGFDFERINVSYPFFDYCGLGMVKVHALRPQDEHAFRLEGSITLSRKMPEGLRNRTFAVAPFLIRQGDNFGKEITAIVPPYEPVRLWDTLEFSTETISFWTGGTMRALGEIGKLIGGDEVKVNFIAFDGTGYPRGFDTQLLEHPFSLYGITVTPLVVEKRGMRFHIIGHGRFPALSDNLQLPIHTLSINPETGGIDRFILRSSGMEKISFKGWDVGIFGMEPGEKEKRVQASLFIPGAMQPYMPGWAGRGYPLDSWVINHDGEIVDMKLQLAYMMEVDAGDGYRLLARDPALTLTDPQSGTFTMTFNKVGLFPPESSRTRPVQYDRLLSFNSSGELYCDGIPLDEWTAQQKGAMIPR
jgi:hypothetical protein